MTTKLNVILTQSYRLTSDGERNFSIEQLVTVDPTKAPGWAAKLAADPTLGGEPRQEWRDTGNYFAMTAKGLAAAIEYVAVRAAFEDTGETRLSEFAATIRDNFERFRKAVEGAV